MGKVRHGEIRIADAMRAIKALIENPDDTAQVFRIIEALSGKNVYLNLARMRMSAEGRALLREKPDLLAVLLDRKALEALPEDSLGRAYLRFLDSEGITVEGLHQASIEGRGDQGDVPPEVDFVRNRLRDTHDLWHTVTGYQGDIVGEAALLAFSFAQVFNLGIGFIASVAFLRDPQSALRREVVRGLTRGFRARWLLAVHWENLLALPLTEVRAQLRIAAPPRYTAVRVQDWKKHTRVAAQQAA